MSGEVGKQILVSISLNLLANIHRTPRYIQIHENTSSSRWWRHEAQIKWTVLHISPAQTGCSDSWWVEGFPRVSARAAKHLMTIQVLSVPSFAFIRCLNFHGITLSLCYGVLPAKKIKWSQYHIWVLQSAMKKKNITHITCLLDWLNVTVWF